MVQKRPFHDEGLFKVSSKHARQFEHNNELVPFLEFVPSEHAFQKPFTSAEGGFTRDRVEGDEKLASDSITELPVSTVDSETHIPGCLSISLWATSSTSEEDVRSEAAVYEPFSPEYSNPDCPIRTFVRSEEIYSSLLDYPPRKPVPIGPDHQADIPTWGLHGTENNLTYLDSSEPVILSHKALDSDLVVGNDDEKKLVGNCVIPMPDSEPSSHNADKVGNGRTDCSCQDRGSLRCVRQHITEAREILRRALGQERFVELGFCDMGEVVTQKWSDEEEQLFHEVVFSNPASLGKNFWDNLSIVFPFRAKKDIVSYYFNVFMLRRRAEQNRCDPMNIDSDNDEWQGSEDYGDDELGMAEEDEDSVVESPVYQDDLGYNRSREDDAHEYDEDGVDETLDNNGSVDFSSCKGITNIPEKCLWKYIDYCSSDPTFQLSGKINCEEGDDHDVQDDSCTSSDTGVPAQGTRAKVDNSDHWPGSFNTLNNGGGHGFVLEPCDAKVWDTGYMTRPKNEIDFLPTCSVIEEVLGDAAWNYKARDGKGLS